jgi:hypothetical protein
MKLTLKVVVTSLAEVELTDEEHFAILTGDKSLCNLFAADCLFGRMNEGMGREDLNGDYSIEVIGVGGQEESFKKVEVFSTDSYESLESARASGGSYVAEIPDSPHAAVLSGMKVTQACLGNESVKAIFTEDE